MIEYICSFTISIRPVTTVVGLISRLKAKSSVASHRDYAIARLTQSGNNHSIELLFTIRSDTVCRHAVGDTCGDIDV